MAPKQSPQNANSGEQKGPAPTDQNSGDLHAFLLQLAPSLPENAGEMPMGELLQHLRTTSPKVFTNLNQLFQTARVIASLDDAMANKWKEKGNEEYKKKHTMQAVLSYTNGLLCAKEEETVATLLNNRSTALMELHRYADACLDAHRALRYNPSYWKALLRRGRALVALGFKRAGEKDVAAAEAESGAKANTDEEMHRIFGESAVGMSEVALPPRATVHEAVRVERGSNKGRSLVSQTRLEAGTTVLQESPYALAARTESLLSVCSYCLQYSTNLYHGDAFREHSAKSRGFFCSEKCAEAAWTYYGAKETTHPFFLCCPNDALLAYRMMRGTEQFPQLAELKAAADFDTVGGVGATHIRTLEGSFSKELQPNVAGCGGYESLVAAIALHAEAVTEAEAEQLRKAQRQVLLNSRDVTCIIRTAAAPTSSAGDSEMAALTQSQTSTVRLGQAIYAVGSLINHSCDPNCFVSFAGSPQGSSAQLVVRTIRPVMEGEELTIAYGGISRFSFHSMRHRLSSLRERYGFACVCNTCRNQVDEPVAKGEKEHYIQASDYYQKGRRMIREGNFVTAVTVLLQSYEIVMRHICPPPEPPQWMLIKTHDALAQAYFLLQDRPKCLEHLKEALRLDIEIHQTDNRIELVNEYTRLAFLATEAADKQLYVEKAVTLLRRFYGPSTMLDLQIAYVESSLKAGAAPKAA